jgi:hypothetical protein
MNPLRILRLTVENYQCITICEVTPDPGADVFEVAGPNESGKSSLLSSVQIIVEGIKAMPDQPVRNGAAGAKWSAEIGTKSGPVYVVDRVIDGAGKATLSIKKANGKKFSSSQGFMDDLAKHLGFDPQSFIDMKPRDQFETLRAIAGVDADEMARLDRQKDDDYKNRTDWNTKRKDAEAAAGMVEVPEGAPAQREDVAKLIDELRRINDHNAAIVKEKNYREKTAETVESLRKDAVDIQAGVGPREADEVKRRDKAVAEYERQIGELRKRIAGAQAECDQNVANLRNGAAEKAARQISQADRLQAELDAKPPLRDAEDTAAIEERIASADEGNRAVAARERRDELLAAADRAKEQSAKLTKAIDAAVKAKQDMVAAAQLPVDGIGFGDGVILLHGTPFDQASSGAKWQTACAIAMSGGPELRVLLVREGSLMDKKKRAVLTAMARERGYQLWLETVSDVDVAGAVMMREGAVVRSLADAPAVALGTMLDDVNAVVDDWNEGGDDRDTDKSDAWDN